MDIKVECFPRLPVGALWLSILFAFTGICIIFSGHPLIGCIVGSGYAPINRYTHRIPKDYMTYPRCIREDVEENLIKVDRDQKCLYGNSRTFNKFDNSRQ